MGAGYLDGWKIGGVPMVAENCLSLGFIVTLALRRNSVRSRSNCLLYLIVGMS
jgi:hypothetical protein